MVEGTGKAKDPGVDPAANLLRALAGNATEQKTIAISPDLLKEFKTNNSSLKTLIEKLNTLITTQQAADDDTGEESKQALQQEKPKEVVISEIKDPALEKIAKALQGLGMPAKSAAAATTAPASSSGGGTGNLGGVFSKVFGSALVPLVTGLAGSLALAIGSWFNEGPWKGVMKEVGKLGVDIFLPKIVDVASKLFPALAKFLGPIAKKLPVIGFIINLGSAISRVIAGDVVGGLIDLASGIATFVPGIGTAISIGLGFLNAARDLSGATEGTKKGDTTSDTGFAVLVKTVAPFLAKIGSKLKFVPILGNILSIGLAFQHFKQGGLKGWSQGILDLISGIAGFVPGVGTVVSYVAAGLSFLIDLMSGGEEKKDEKNEEPKAGASKGIFSMIGSFIGDKVKKSLRYLPGVGTLIQLGEAFDNFKNGKIKDGFKSLMKAGLTLIPGVGSVVAWLMEDKVEEPKSEGEGTGEKFDASTIYKAITDGVKDKFKTILKNLKKISWIPNSVVDKIAGFLGIDIGDKAKEEPAKQEAAPASAPAAPAAAATPAAESASYEDPNVANLTKQQNNTAATSAPATSAPAPIAPAASAPATPAASAPAPVAPAATPAAAASAAPSRSAPSRSATPRSGRKGPSSASRGSQSPDSMPSGATPSTPNQEQTAPLPGNVQGSADKAKTDSPKEKRRASTGETAAADAVKKLYDDLVGMDTVLFDEKISPVWNEASRDPDFKDSPGRKEFINNKSKISDLGALLNVWKDLDSIMDKSENEKEYSEKTKTYAEDTTKELKKAVYEKKDRLMEFFEKAKKIDRNNYTKEQKKEILEYGGDFGNFRNYQQQIMVATLGQEDRKYKDESYANRKKMLSNLDINPGAAIIGGIGAIATGAAVGSAMSKGGKKGARFGGVFQGSEEGYPMTLHGTEAVIPLQPNTDPRVPLESPLSSLPGMPGSEMSKKLDELITAVQTLKVPSGGSNSAASVTSTDGGSNVTNVFNNGTERDIPYTERTKYRNQLMYSRALL